MKPWQSTAIATAIASAVLSAPLWFLAQTTRTENGKPEIVATEPAVIELISGDQSAKHKAEIGELVRLKSDGDHVAWDVIPQVPDWLSYGEANSNYAISFRRAGEYTIVAAPTKSGRAEIRRIVVTIGPVTVIPPTPTPNPTIPVMPTSFWDAKIVGWIGGDPARKADSPKLADSFAAVAGQIEAKLVAGELLTAEQIITLTAAANQSAIASSTADWSGFRAALSEELKAMSAQGKLADMRQHATTWREISVALRKAAL